MEENLQNVKAPKPEKNNEFVKQLLDALIHLGLRLFQVFILLPLDFWKNAVVRMSKQRNEGALNITTQSDFPFLSWIKRFVFEFVIDALTFIAWPLFFFTSLGDIIDCFKLMKYDFAEAFFAITITLYIVYFMPVILSIVRDLLNLVIVLPIRWILSFLRRPAKTYDLNHTGNIK